MLHPKRLVEYFRMFLQPPVFPDDEEKTRQALILTRFLSIFSVVMIFLLVIGLPFIYQKKAASLMLLCLCSATVLIARWLMQRGHIRPAGQFLVGFLWVIGTALILLGAGLRDINLVFIVTITVIAGLLLGQKSAVIVTAISILSTLTMVVLEVLGYLPIRYFPPTLIVGWLQMAFALILATATMNITLTSLEDSLRLARERLNERRQAEKSLQDSEERYRTIFENAVEGLFQVTTEGRLMQINPAMARIFGYDSTIEMIENTYARHIPNYESAEQRQKLVQGLEKQGTLINYEQPMLRKDGKKIWVSVNARVVKDAEGRSLYYEGSLVDITERKEVGEAIQEKQTRIEEAYRLARLGAWYWAKGATAPEWSDGMYEIFGLDPELPPPSVQEHDRFYAPGHWNRRREGNRQTLETGEPHQMEVEIIRADGAHRWTNTYCAPRHDGATGEIIGLYGTVQDITDRKLAEEAIREKQDRIEEAYRLARLGAWSWTKEDNIMLWTKEVYAMFGLDPKSPPPSVEDIHSLYAPGYWKRRLKATKKVMETGEPYQMELEIVYSDGSRHWLNTYCGPQRDAAGKIIGLYGTLQDITDRKIAEEALRASETRYRLLAENVRDVIFTMDLQLHFTYVSPYVQNLLGYSPEEYQQMPFHETIAPEALEKVMQLYAKEMEIESDSDKDMNRSLVFEIDSVHQDGRLIPCEVKTSFLRDAAGQAIGILGVTRDIAERKRAEAERKKWEEQLIQAQKLEAIGTLAGGIAHDFNNLLMGIQGYASLMLLDMTPGHPHYESLRNIERQVHSGAGLTKQLLGYARGGKYESKPTDMNRFLDRNSRLFGRTRKEIQIIRNFDASIWPVEVDPGQMDQVFLNLYINAWHAMPAGGDLTVSTQNIFLGEDDANSLGIPPGRYVRISVQDTGIGMDEKTLARIFDPFFTTKEMGRGSGLGLASAYGILRNHGGMITAQSNKGFGSTFHVSLPASAAAIVRDEQRPLPQLIPGEETVLYVDDEKTNRIVAEAMLKNLGYTVFLAGNGQEALDIYRRRKDDIYLIILDLIMPGLSGSDTFDGLRSINPHARIVLCSGYSLDGQAQNIMERGARAFLQKPFGLEELSGKIRSALNDA